MRQLIATAIVAVSLSVFTPARGGDFEEGSYSASDEGGSLLVKAGVEKIFSLRCDDVLQAQKTRDNDGAFRLAVTAIDAPPGADFKLRIYKYDVASPVDRKNDILLDEMAFTDLAGDFANGARALSRQISPIYKKPRWDCPILRVDLQADNSAGAEASVEMAQILYSYRKTSPDSGLTPQGEVTTNSDIRYKQLSLKSAEEFAAVNAFAKSIARLRIKPGVGEPIDCTAFPIGPRQFLTNYHCVNDADRGISLTPKSADCGEIQAFVGEIESEERQEWKCLKILFANEALDTAVIELEPIDRKNISHVTPAVLPTQVTLDAPDPLLQNGSDYATVLLHHQGGWPLRISFDCNDVKRIDDATRYSLRHQGIPFSEATLVHRCTSGGGSSGAPLIAIVNGRPSLVGLHHSDYLRDDYEAAKYGSCIKNFVKEAYPDFDFGNLAIDASAIRCAIEKGGPKIDGLDPSVACRTMTIPEVVSEKDEAAVEALGKECRLN